MVSPMMLSKTVLSVISEISNAEQYANTRQQILKHFSNKISPVWVDMSLQDLEKMGLVKRISYWGLRPSYQITSAGREFLESDGDIINAENPMPSKYIFESCSDNLERKIEISNKISDINWTKWGTLIAAVTLVVTIVIAQ